MQMSRNRYTHHIIEAPDGIILVYRRNDYRSRNRDPVLVYSIRRTPNIIHTEIEEKIESLSERNRFSSVAHTNEERAQQVSEEIRRLQSISSNIRPLALNEVNSDMLSNFTTAFIVFFSLGLLIFISKLCLSAIILISPDKSKTFKVLSKYGNPRTLLLECEKSLSESEKLLRLGRAVINKQFVILPRLSYIYIAPIGELLWAHLAMHYYRNGIYSLLGKHTIELYFSTGEHVSIHVEDKRKGVSDLNWIKKCNPYTLVGYDYGLFMLYENQFDVFKSRIKSNLEQLQKTTSAGVQADY